MSTRTLYVCRNAVTVARVRQFVLAALVACGGGNTTPGVDASPPDAASIEDGTPTRVACTSNFGQLLPASGTFGRLDGYLVSIVPPSNMHGCNADTSHVHLQIRMKAAIYDVAVDATDGATNMDDVHTTTIDQPLPSPGWVEGWHDGVNLDYTQYGIHSTDLPFVTKQQVVDTLNADLAIANHVSIYMTTYGGDGGHLVHRNGAGRDGVIVTAPLAVTSHLRLLSFTNVAF